MKFKLATVLVGIGVCAILQCDAQTASFTHISDKARIFDQVCSAAVLTSTADKMPVADEVACGAYMEGLAEGMLARNQAQALERKRTASWPCFTPGITPQELIGVALNFLAEHPNMNDSPTGGVVALAFMHKFPCT